MLTDKQIKEKAHSRYNHKDPFLPQVAKKGDYQGFICGAIWARDKCNEWISVDIKPNDKQKVRVTDCEDVNEGCYYANYYGGFPRLIKGPNSEEIYADAKYWQPVSEPPKK